MKCAYKPRKPIHSKNWFADEKFLRCFDLSMVEEVLFVFVMMILQTEIFCY
jgi:hypothetical protein